MTNTDSDFTFFWGGFLSQWQLCELEMDGKRFNCAEQAMMYLKAVLFSDEKTAELIHLAQEPGQQKALGRRVGGFDEAIWNKHKFNIVLRVNRAKFGQNKGLRRKLFQTGNTMLAEASPLDTVWGVGLDADAARAVPPDHWPGQNLLGRILTQVRDELAQKFPEESAAVST